MNTPALFSTLLQGAPPDPLIAATKDAVRDVLAKHGSSAFTMTRKAALVHETGHAIVLTHEGLKVRSVKIFSRSVLGVEAWGGRCMHAGGAWSSGPDSSVDSDLLHARVAIAGLAGEAICGLDRPGSSLDEVVLSQVLGCNVAVKLDGYSRRDEDYAAWGRQLWNEQVWNVAIKILRANREPFMQLVQHLHENERVKGAKLHHILDQVRRINL
jgi:hypothetical protein